MPAPITQRLVRSSAVAMGVLVVVMMVLLSACDTSDGPDPEGASAPGAAVLLDPEQAGVEWSEIRTADSITPRPQDAKEDRPSVYDPDTGCQVQPGDPVPQLCTAGDTSATRTVVLVGDSKIAQWETAFADLGKREGWRVQTRTKSGCAFADASITGGNKVLTDCRAWGRATLKELLTSKPDVVVTSQVQDAALPEGKTSGQDATREAMIEGLGSYWRKLQAAGIQVVVLLNNPMPTTHPVYECVEDHPDDLAACSFSLAKPLSASSAPMQRDAAAATPGVGVIDMAPVYCPGEQRCPAVMGNVLLYRAGSHLTRTFVVSAEPQLAEQLARVTDGRFGAG